MPRRLGNSGPRLGIAVALAILASLVSASPAAGLELRVRDNQLVNRRGEVVRLLGVNRSGAEYACIQG